MVRVGDKERRGRRRMKVKDKDRKDKTDENVKVTDLLFKQ